jgi:hypothetical protein
MITGSLCGGTFSWTFINDKTNRVRCTKSKFKLQCNGKVNGVEAYTIISASGDIVGKTFSSGELFYDVKNNCINLSLTTKSIYAENEYLQLSSFLQASSKNVGHYYGGISYTEPFDSTQGDLPKGQCAYGVFKPRFK